MGTYLPFLIAFLAVLAFAVIGKILWVIVKPFIGKIFGFIAIVIAYFWAS